MNAALGGFQLASGAEPIPGYVLQERIGAGGYGEVWKATAPGGLQKAVKFVYGHLDDARAAHELKSLNRVKELNHPFLLALERIEIVDGHLMIVTALADSSLRERFEECRESGLPGIPHDELLPYMKETAEALDYIFDSHGLQHLDVKPENVLLSGTHTRLADFGLLKDLHEINASLVNGMSPRYAAPELFDGKPSRHCDQYSLAIVYQEMATGQVPFDGATAAKLASQHLHCTPDLSGLTPLERFAVSKALSKDANRRFRNCREFVDRLLHRSRASITPGIVEPNAAGRGARDVSGAAPQGPAATPRAVQPPAGTVHDGQTVVVTAPEIDTLPPMELDEEQVRYRPTLFVGVGGTGAKVLCRLRQLLSDRFGDLSSVPAFGFLLLDTDIGSITAATRSGEEGSLTESDSLLVPLRSTWEYRDKAISTCRSVSRRWIYNIPRSLRTEGLRAVGRMALLDHARRILDRLRSAIVSVTDADAVTASAERTGLDFRHEDPRVFIVASVAGGTGGGMAIDLGYAVRQVLAELGLSDENVCGIFSYSTPPGESGRSLAPANAFACLEELHYFSLPGNHYPGETTCGLFEFREDSATFAGTYLFDFGDGLDDDRYEESIDRLATYLVHSSASPASAFFDACRNADADDDAGDPFNLRTAGLCPVDADNRKLKTEWIELLCHSVVRNWRGGLESADEESRVRPTDYGRLLDKSDCSNSDKARYQQWAAERAAELGLEPQQLTDRLGILLGTELGCDPDAYFRGIAADYLDKAFSEGHEPETAFSVTLRRLSAIFGREEDDAAEFGVQVETLREVLFPKASELGREIGEALQAWILDLVDAPESRITGARRVVEGIVAYLEAVQVALGEKLRWAKEAYAARRRELTALLADPKQRRRLKRKALLEHLHECVALLQDELAREAACKVIRAAEPFTAACSDQLRDLWKDLNRLSEEFRVSEAADVAEDPQDESDGGLLVSMGRLIADQRREMIAELDRDIERDFLSDECRLLQLLTQGSSVRSQFTARMRTAARNVILRFARRAALERMNQQLQRGDSSELNRPLRRCIEAAAPGLLKAGGAKRLLLVTPDPAEADRLRHEVQRVSGDPASVARDAAGNVMVCYEAEQISLGGIATRLMRSRPDCQELASRLHTRVDIDWPAGGLLAPTTAAPPCSVPQVAASPVETA